MKILATLLLSGSLLTATAQKNEFVVTNTGDTIHGHYKVVGNHIMVDMADGKQKDLNADQVQYASSGSGVFTVLHLALQGYSEDIQILIDAGGYFFPKPKDTTLLLTEIYSTPKMNLYSAIDNFKTPYYFVKRPSDPVPLQMLVRFEVRKPFPEEERRLGNAPILQQFRIYADQLKSFMNCPKISDDTWALMEYREFSFKKLIKLYNKKCK